MRRLPGPAHPAPLHASGGHRAGASYRSLALAPRSILAVGFLVALAIRLTLLLRFPGDFDTESYKIVAAILARGGDLYRETDRYNYSPAWGFVLLGADRLAGLTGADLTRVVGLLLLAVDAAIASVVFRLARERSDATRSALAALLFFSNPVSILMSSAHCQFDNVSILFLLLAIRATHSDPVAKGGVTASLSASLLFKHVTWFHPLLFVRRRGRQSLEWAAAAVPYLVFLLSFLPYWRSWREIWSNVFEHRGLTGYYGIEGLQLLPGFPQSQWALTVIFVLAMLVAVLLFRRLDLGRASLLLFLVILIFLPGFQGQYLVWPLALGSLYRGPGYLLYTVVSGTFLIHIMPGMEAVLPFLPGWYGPWWAAIAWLLWELRALSKSSPRSRLA